MSKICENCGARYSARRFNAEVRRFCSRGCANRSRPRKTWCDKHGYPQISVDGRCIPLHRYVMEQVLGRKLLPGETVHHKDGDRANADPANLELWTTRHGRGQRARDLRPGVEVILGTMGMGA